jgi:hypothetical protein
MAVTRMITTAYWNDDDIQEMSAMQRAFYVFLMTAPDSNICGLFKMTYKTMSFFSGWDIEQVKECVQYLTEKGKLVYDSGLVFVTRMAKHQKGETFGNFNAHCHKVSIELWHEDNNAYDAFLDEFSDNIEEYKLTGTKGFKKGSKNPSEKGSTNSKGNSKDNNKGNVNSSFERGVGKTFIPPTLNEVELEFQNKKHPNPKDMAESFIAYYEARGWMLKGVKVKSWKACVVTWMKNGFSNNGKGNYNGKQPVANSENSKESRERLTGKLEAIERAHRGDSVS